jgi:hypothetical protein
VIPTSDGAKERASHPRHTAARAWSEVGNCWGQELRKLVDLDGFGPSTSSIPWGLAHLLACARTDNQ